jgi:hypothetical protein
MDLHQHATTLRAHTDAEWSVLRELLERRADLL